MLTTASPAGSPPRPESRVRRGPQLMAHGLAGRQTNDLFTHRQRHCHLATCRSVNAGTGSSTCSSRRCMRNTGCTRRRTVNSRSSPAHPHPRRRRLAQETHRSPSSSPDAHAPTRSAHPDLARTLAYRTGPGAESPSVTSRAVLEMPPAATHRPLPLHTVPHARTCDSIQPDPSQSPQHWAPSSRYAFRSRVPPPRLTAKARRAGPPRAAWPPLWATDSSSSSIRLS